MTIYIFVVHYISDERSIPARIHMDLPHHRRLRHRTCGWWSAHGTPLGRLDVSQRHRHHLFTGQDPAPSRGRNVSPVRQCVSLGTLTNLTHGEVWWLSNSHHPRPFCIHYFKSFSISFQLYTLFTNGCVSTLFHGLSSKSTSIPFSARSFA